jgi:adenylosuccinate lyase
MEYIAALSPLDDRYRQATQDLLPFFSEHAFFSYRAEVELRYLTALVETVKPFTLTAHETQNIHRIALLSQQDYLRIKAIEQKTSHDLKALEYFLVEKLNDPRLTPFIHFGLTSEDTNNIAYALMLSDALSRVILPALSAIQDRLLELADQYRAAPILARTHGQPASPTTFGKEMRVFHARLQRRVQSLQQSSLTAKLNGATGNYSALTAAYPHVDWVRFSQNFITSFNHNRPIPLHASLLTTQINPPEALVDLFDNLRGVNNILLDLCRDNWRYISDGWLIQSAQTGEIGSSTMPHKVNPIHFENAEGNLGLASALLMHFSQTLPISRLQRDLSSSTLMRNIGVAFGHTLLAYHSLIKGLSRIQLDSEKCAQILSQHPQVITEAIQTILRREGIPDAYEQLLALSRGKEITRIDIEQFINELDIHQDVKKELLALTPINYIGLADQLS